jgi:hypothetical protein
MELKHINYDKPYEAQHEAVIANVLSIVGST